MIPGACLRSSAGLGWRFVLVAIWLTLSSHPALAYRPFDSTDAAVAGAGEFELELGPIGHLREGTNKFWVAPAVIANIGLEGDRELVLQGQRQQLREVGPGAPSAVW